MPEEELGDITQLLFLFFARLFSRTILLVCSSVFPLAMLHDLGNRVVSTAGVSSRI
jgi:hypothetical protein